MRYFIILFVVCVAAVLAIAGKRGSLSRRTPLEVFPDMKRQLKLRPQQPNAFFANGLSSQLPVAGTIARGTPIQTAAGPVLPFEDAPVNTGRVTTGGRMPWKRAPLTGSSALNRGTSLLHTAPTLLATM